MPLFKDFIKDNYKSLYQMALKIDPVNGQDFLHDAFLKIPENKEVNITYIYFTIKNLMIDEIRKNKEQIYDFSNYEVAEVEAFDYDSQINELQADLTTFQKILIDLIRNHKLTLLKIAKETNIEYKVIYRNYQKIKKLCKGLAI